MIRVAVSGAAGRMGRLLLRLVSESEDLRLVGALESSDHPDIGRDAGALAGTPSLRVSLTSDPAAALHEADVVVDFSTPAALQRVLEVAANAGIAAVVGTTGQGPAGRAALERAARTVPVVAAPNMSVGVNVLLHLVEDATRRLGPGFDLEVFEMHHRQKADAPSGTAVRLGEVVARARGIDPSKVVHGRSGAVGPRPDDEIGVLALRGGDVVGEHTVYFTGLGERIEITHRAWSRENFARGALRAARWVRGRPKGLYDMDDVLGPGE